MPIGFEIDFLPVGNGERAGDAIALRYGDLHGPRDSQRVVIIDAGFRETGEQVVDFIQNRYGTDRVDLAISTHPDSDHCAGLTIVLEKLAVGELWMHRPWEHTSDISDVFRDGRVTDESVAEALRHALDDARELERIANRKSIPIREPFVGIHDGNGLVVLGPTKEYYESLLPHFRSTPEPRKSVFGTTLEKLTEGARAVFESFGVETLTDEGETSAENNSSTVLCLCYDSKYCLLTGDAGAPALARALDILERASGSMLPAFTFVQVPHHGSRRNIGPTLLNRMIGSPRDQDEAIVVAFASTPTDPTSKHPSKRVTNAFRRRGAPVHLTSGLAKWHFHNAPPRDNYSTSVPEPLHFHFEE
jgi:beta-lactamase superfamily II metal-dependent hydrolase